ncbi:hypothetical protein D3C73_1191190 [compost metagenome]
MGWQAEQAASVFHTAYRLAGSIDVEAVNDQHTAIVGHLGIDDGHDIQAPQYAQREELVESQIGSPLVGPFDDVLRGAQRGIFRIGGAFVTPVGSQEFGHHA